MRHLKGKYKKGKRYLTLAGNKNRPTLVFP